METKSNILMYQTEDGITKIDVTLENETVWLTQAQMSELFQRDVSVISRHIQNVFEEGELDEKSNLQNMQIANSDKPIKLFSLDVIISVGYRVKSLRGTQFRIWANTILKEYMVKGFAMNDEFLKKAGGGNYFKELLERIRDIRSSERVFYRQILDIYATSIDYDKNAETSITLFKTIQNKMHFAISGHTAAEIVYLRADHTKPFMGLTSFESSKPKKAEVINAKNYLKEDEIKRLNALVSSYLDFAEYQALRHIPMYMNNWVQKLDDFLKASDSEILTNSGKISHDDAEEKALLEYATYKKLTNDELSPIERDFLDTIKTTQKIIEKKTS